MSISQTCYIILHSATLICEDLHKDVFVVSAGIRSLSYQSIVSNKEARKRYNSLKYLRDVD